MSKTNGKKRQRRQFTPEEMATILRRHLAEKVPVSDLCDEYQIPRDHWLTEEERRDILHVDLLVLEDFGMKKLGSAAAEDLLEVFVRRHKTASTPITTNRPTQDWGIFLGDVPAATAILDRFLAHATIIQMAGKSYRLRSRSSPTPEA